MPIDEKALEAAAKARWELYRKIDGQNRVAWEGVNQEMVRAPLIEEMRPIIEAYEAAKKAGQPVDMSFEEWKKRILPNAGAVIHEIAHTAWNAALATKLESGVE